MKFETGTRFIGFIKDTFVHGQINCISDREIYLCQNRMCGLSTLNKLSYEYSWLIYYDDLTVLNNLWYIDPYGVQIYIY